MRKSYRLSETRKQIANLLCSMLRAGRDSAEVHFTEIVTESVLNLHQFSLYIKIPNREGFCYTDSMYLDLSVVLNEQTPVYPGDPTPKFSPAGVLGKEGFIDHSILVGTHLGTHIDAPMHMLEDGKSLDKIPLEQFIGNGKLVEVTSDAFEIVKAAGIEEGDIVLFRTGMSEKYHDPSYFGQYPAMSEDVAQYLVESKVKMVGVDTCSVDNQDGFPIHKILLAGNVLIIENLTNLNQLTNKDFKVFALPLNLQIDGSPARVIAEITK